MSTNKKLIRALVVFAIACTAMLLPSHSVKAVLDPAAFVCFPTCINDGRFLTIGGTGINTLSGSDIFISLNSAPFATEMQWGVFDGNTANQWDSASMSPLQFELYLDPHGDASGFVPANLVMSESGPTMPDNDWANFSYTNPAAVAPVAGAARACATCPYRYLLRIYATNTSAPGTSNFKIRTDGTLGVRGNPFGFYAPFFVLADAETVYPAWPAVEPTTYDGTWRFGIWVETPASRVTVWDGDLDWGKRDCLLKDDDDPDSPAFPTEFTLSSATQPEGKAVGGSCQPASVGGFGSGSPGDDSTDITARRSPSWGSNLVYRVIKPNGTSYFNHEPSGNSEWEQFTISSTAPIQVSTITLSGSTATATTPGAHGRVTGDIITIAGAADPGYNGTFPIIVTGASAFTFELTSAPSSPATIAVSSLTRSGSTATATTAVPHGRSTGDLVTIGGADQAAYNGTFGITVTGPTTFLFTVTGTPVTPATGSITTSTITAVPNFNRDTMDFDTDSLPRGVYEVRVEGVDMNNLNFFRFNYALLGLPPEGPPSPPEAFYRIGRLVWKDLNRDGDHDSGEPVIPNVSLTIIDENNDVQTGFTGADGQFFFRKPAGEYEVVIDGDNFLPGKPLENMASTTGGETQSGLKVGVEPDFDNYAEALFGYMNPSPPTANDDTAASACCAGAGEIDVLANDTDLENDDLTITEVSQPSNGTAAITGVAPNQKVTYTPNTGFSGEDIFTYTIDDGVGGTDIGIVTVTVTNSAPIANDDTATTLIDTPVTISVLSNDSDVEDGAAALLSVSGGLPGSSIEIVGNTIVYTPPPGFTGTDNTITYTVRDRCGAEDTANVVITLQSSSLSGFVYVDINNNGIKESGEAAIAGATVTLSGTNDLGSIVPVIATTDGLGAWTFTHLRPGTYKVVESQPSGYLDGKDTIGTPGGATASDEFNSIVLGNNTHGVNNNFGELPPASLSGFVYVDVDNDGNKDSGEAAIPNAIVTISGSNDLGSITPYSTTTDPSGQWTFTDLRPGTYTVVETQPAGFLDGKDTIGTPGGSAANDQFSAIVLGIGATGANNNFGEIPPSSLTGFVYVDADNDGNKDVGELPIAGVTVTLTGNHDLVPSTVGPLTAVTDANGKWIFNDLRPGTYKVVETQPVTPVFYLDGKDTIGSHGGVMANDQFNAVVLGIGVNGVNYNFGELLPASLSGFVYADADNDGNRESGEAPISGVTVTLTGINDLGTIPSTPVTTDTNGAWSFTNLRPGLYTVTETHPAAYLDGKDTQGTPGGGTTTNDKFSTITLNMGVSGADNNFGELPPASLSGFVYVDADNDGFKDPSETPIPGTTVTLTGSNDLGPIAAATSITDVDGKWSFTNLRPGTYIVEESQPSGHVDGRDTIGSQGGTTLNDVFTTVVLGIGVSGEDNNFGELMTSSLAGFVYVDANNNGLKDSGEAPIAGVTVTLTGNNDQGAVGPTTTTTDSFGAWKFSDLRPGVYTVTESQPSSYLDGKDTIGTPGGDTSNDEFTDIPLAMGVHGEDNNFGELQPSSLAGFVYVDPDNDGFKDSGEAIIAGATVTLTGTNDLGPIAAVIATTDSLGAWKFENLRPGTYVVTETQPGAYLDGKDTIGTPGGTTGNDVFSGIVLASNVNGIDNNFGELEPASVSGYVYVDANNDGVKDGGETGIITASVSLNGMDLNGVTVNLTTTTDGNGFYSFPNLMPGTYTVTETQPAGHLDGKDTQGTPGGAIVNDDQFQGIVLNSGVDGVNNNFGENLPSSLAGFVYHDVDNDGVFGSGDSPIAGATVTLTGTNWNGVGVNVPVTTGGTGAYSFAGLYPGTYTIDESQPSGYIDGKDTQGTPNNGTANDDQFAGIDLGHNVHGTDNNFGERQAASLAGFVYYDVDNDGAFDSGELAIENATVVLSGTDDRGASVSLTTVTNASGAWSFTDLRPGTYTVTETQPDGYIDGKDTQGTPGNGSVDPDAYATITLGSGVHGTNNNFGELQAASIAGFVYVDTDNDGVKNGSEDGIGGVTVELTGTNAYGASVSLTTVTIGTGAYSFPDLVPGTYTLTETQPSGYLDGKDTQGTPGTGGTLTNDAFTEIVLNSAVHGENNNFGELPAASLAGFVYHDRDNDGVKCNVACSIPGVDPGIGGVVITLSGQNDLGQPVNTTATTDSNGAWKFLNLRPGTYTATEAHPAGYLDGKDTQGTPGTGTVANDAFNSIVLAAGVNGDNNNFGEVQASSLAGFVYIDANDDGVKDGGEAGIEGVTVTLTGTDDLGAPVNTPATTVTGGAWSFTGLRPGTYVVTETQPGAYLDGKDTVGTPGGTTANDAFSAIVLGSNVHGTDNNFGELQASSLAGFVYVDADNDGVKGGSEAGIEGVTVTLTGTDDLGNAVNTPGTTATDGAWSFTGLRPGTYVVTETQPGAYLDGKDTIGTQGGTTANDVFNAIVLGSNVHGTDNNFGELQASSLAGFVYVDANNDGVKDSGEAGIEGVTVTLTGTDDLGAPVNTPVTTVTGGAWSFTGLRPGTYVVTETQPGAYLDGKDTIGTQGGTTANDVFNAIVLGSNVHGTDNNFGELQASSLAGFVYVDANNDGVKDGGEAGIENVTVTLTGTDDLGAPVNTPATTVTGGAWSFTGLRPGTYVVTETQPGAYLDGKDTIGTQGGTTANDVFSAIVLGSNVHGTDNNFGELQASSLAGFVYVDADNDGLKGSSEAGIEGVTVTLTGTDDLGAPVNTPATTVTGGAWSFTGLRPGTYVVTETQPGAYLDGKDTVGTPGGTTTNDAFSAIVLGSNVHGTDNNFGELQASSLAGFVYVDADNDGVKGGSEAGIEGVTVTLTGTDDLGNAVNTPGTTVTGGAWSFTGLRPGTYVVTETQPGAYLDGKDTIGTQGGTTANDVFSAIVLGSNVHGTDNNFGELQASSLAGFVYVDADNDGLKGSSEAGIEGVTVTLTGTDDLGAPVNTPATTVTGGAWSFTGLRPGTYVVTETQPGAYLDGKDTVGTPGGTTTNDAFSAIVLGTNVHGTNNNFGELQASSLAGFVYVDANNDGVKDGGEAGIESVTVTLTGTDDLGAPVNTPATTVTGGAWSFTGLRPGIYVVTETQPGAYLDGKDTVGTPGGTTTNDAFSAIVLGSNVHGTDNNFGELQASSLAGFVYVDANNDGVKDSGEAGIEGVTVTLTGTDDLGAPVNTPATTVTGGAWSFTGLRPGTYVVTETQPGAYLDGKDTVGTPGGTTTNDAFSAIVLGSNVHGTDNNFGELQASSLAGFVYVDADNDGVKGGSEAGIEGVPVTLTGTDDLGNAVNTPGTTATDGAWSFTGLRPGTYVVTETQPGAYLDGKDTVGTPGGTTTNDAFSAIVLGSNVHGTDNNFGELQASSLAGFVYVDADNDGVKGGSEAGIEGVTVTLTGTDDLGNAVNTPGTTVTGGAWSFTGLRPGTYVVTETQPGAYLDGKDTIGTPGGTTTNDAFSAIVLGSNVHGTNNNFGELQASSLAGFVYVDANNDGVKDSSEAGIEGVTVTLTGTDDLGAPVTTPVTTVTGGAWSFTGLRPGTYTVTETQPGAYLDGTDTIGTPGGTTTNDAFSAIVLGSNVHGTNNNFGELQASSLAGFVYVDANNDGVKDGGEAGIESVTVTLTGTDDLGAPVNTPATTVTGGAWSFTGLRPGTYVVTETQPNGYFDGKDTIGTQGGTTTDDVFSAIVLGSNVHGVDNNFGELEPATLGDRVWLDRNDNGLQDDGEPGLGSVTVELLTADGVTTLQTTTTDAAGSYQFTVAPGEYRVRFSTPAAGYDKVTDADQGLDAVDSDANGLGVTGSYTLTSGETNLTVDGGLKPIDLSVTKTVDEATPLVGTNVVFTITVTNAGDMSQATNVTLSDILPAGLTYVSSSATHGSYTAPTWTVGSLGSGVTATLEITATVTTAGSKTNFVQVHTGDQFDIDSTPGNRPPPGPPSEDDEAEAGVFGATPSIDIVKKTNGTDNNSPAGPYVAVGSTVNFTYDVTNTGNVTLTNVTVTDDKLPGNVCVIASLAPQATQQCAASTTATAGQYVNTGKVTGEPPSGPPVSDEDKDHHFGQTPSIDIVKLTNDTNNNTAPGLGVIEGAAVTWTYNVTNNGNVTLTDVTLTDDKIGSVICPATTLNAGSSMTCTASGVAIVGQYTNTGTVKGKPPVGDDVTDSDPDNYFGTARAIDVQAAPVCIADTPYVNFTITATNFTPDSGANATLVWKDSLGNVVHTTVIPWSNVNAALTGQVLWPGATVDINGQPTDWPGWLFEGDQWVMGSDGFEHTRPSATVEISVNPTKTITVNYPPATPACSPSPERPGINVVKKTNGSNNDVAPGVYVTVPSTVTWTYEVTNAGNVPLTNVVVTDDNGTAANGGDDFTAALVSGDVNTNSRLDVGELWLFQAQRAAVLGQYTNEGTVTGNPPSGPPVTDEDPDNYFGQTPSIDIVKLTNGSDNNDTPGLYLPVGSLATFTYRVKNTGNVTLTNVVVTDDKIAGPICTIASLAPNATQDCTASTTVVAGQYTNIGTVTGKPPVGDDVTDNDPDNHYGQTPSIDIVKLTNGSDNNDTPGLYLPVSATATFTYRVKNTGNVTLTNVVVTDDKIAGPICTIASLAPNATQDCTASTTVVAGQYTNIGTVTGKPPVGDNVTDNDPDNHYGQTPSIDIVKLTNGSDNNEAPGPNVMVGSTVTWTYNIKNTGNVTLTNVQITDDKVGAICTIPSLAAGASHQCTKDGIAVAGQYVNTGKVTGDPPTGPPVSDEDPDHYNGLQPASIAGFVYVDANNNGAKESGEAAISGVPIALNGTDVFGTIVTLSTTTDVNGFYSFANLKPGTYTVTETQPGGYIDVGDAQGTPNTGTTGNDVFTNVTLESGVNGENNNFGELLPAKISGYVYVDSDNDGVRDSGEAPIGGVTIRLTGTDMFGTAVDQLATTIGTGFYEFTNLVPGTYTVTETQPATHVDGKDTQGTPGNGTPSDDVFANITLNSGVNGQNNNFGELQPASISGYVYVDSDNDGVKDAGEAAIVGATITLTGTTVFGAPVNRTTTSSSTGYYEFTNLVPGTYTVTETQPAGYNDGIDTKGTPNTGTAGNDVFQNIALDSGVNGQNNNFGERLQQASIDIVKKTNGTDNNTAPGVQVTVGTTVTWTYEITNTGNVALTQVALVDDKAGAVTCPATTLAAGASMTCTKTGIAIAGQYTNVGTVTAKTPSNTSVTDNDPDNYFGSSPVCVPVGFTTYTQGGWGAKPNGGNPGSLLHAKFSQVYPSGWVKIGGSKYLKFTSAQAITDFLPQGGTASTLNGSDSNPSSSSAGVFAGQVLALRLSVDFSARGVTKSGLGGLVLVSGPMAGQTVSQVLALAEQVLGGNTSALPSGMSISTLNGIVDALNNNFDNGTQNNNVVGCAGDPVPCVAGTFNMTGGNSNASGTAGNIRTYSAQGVDVKVSAFSRVKKSGSWSTAYLGAFGPGLGVTDGSEGNGSGDTHKNDNGGDRTNYILYEFSQPVVVTRAYLDAIGADSDATIWIGTKSNPYSNHITLSDAVLGSLGAPIENTTTSSNARWANFNSTNVTGNVLVIAAQTSGSNDAFKVAKLDFKSCEDQVEVCTAGTFTLNGNSPTSGAAGNIRSYEAGGVDVKVSAWARAKDNGAWSAAYLGAWAPGVGVTDGSEGNGSGDTHMVDNSGERVNYVLFEFKQPVVVTRAFLDYVGADSDALIYIGTKNDPYNNHQTLSDAFLSSLGAGEENAAGDGNTRWAAFNSAQESGNILVIAALPTGSNDSFKIGKLTFSSCESEVEVCSAGTVSTTGNSNTMNGTDGNVRNFTANGVNIKASAWARAKNNGAWSAAYLGAFSPGLGVTDNMEGDGSGDKHKIDNVDGSNNYVMFEFSAPVKVTKAYLSYLGVDADATVWIGTKNDPYNNHQTLSDSFLSSLGTVQNVDVSGTSAQWISFNGGMKEGNILVIAANPTGNNDAFKLAKLEFTVCEEGASTPANRPPTVSAPDRDDYKKVAVNVQITGTDPDGDQLTYTATGLPTGLSMNTDGLITGTPTVKGTYTVTVTVTDPSNASDSDSFDWEIKNHAPTVTTSNRTDNTGATANLQITGADADNDALTYSATGLPTGTTMNSAGKITGTLNTAGTFTVTVTVKDVDDATGTSIFTWTVVQPNRAPTVSASNRTDTKGASVNFTISGSDADGDSLTYSATGLPSGVSINKTTGKITGTVNNIGTSTVTVKVTDPDDASGTATFTWTVVQPNRAPTVSASNRTDTKGASVNFTISGSDADGDSLTYSATGLPSGVSINKNTGKITGTVNNVGTSTVTVKVTDPDDASDTAIFTWTVVAPNRPPNAVNDAVTAVKNTPKTFAVVGNDSDPDNDTLTITSFTQPSSSKGSVVKNSNNSFTFTPKNNATGTATFTYTISDGDGGTDTGTVTITINSKHYDDDDCDHDRGKNGHRDGDGCDHDDDVKHHHDGDNCDHDKGKKGHKEGDGCEHDRHTGGHHDGDDCDHDKGKKGHRDGDGCEHDRSGRRRDR